MFADFLEDGFTSENGLNSAWDNLPAQRKAASEPVKTAMLYNFHKGCRSSNFDLPPNYPRHPGLLASCMP